MSRGIVSVGELPATCDADNNVAWLPESSTAIEASARLEAGRVYRIVRMAGYGALWLQTIDRGPAQPAIATEIIPDDSRLHPDYRWPMARVQFNACKTHAAIQRLQAQGATDRQAWATTYDRLLRLGLANAALHKLRDDAASEPLHAFAATSWGIWLSYQALVAGDILGFSLDAAAYGYAIISSLQENKTETGSRQLWRRRWSVFPIGVQPDRFVIASVMAATQKLIRPAMD